MPQGVVYEGQWNEGDYHGTMTYPGGGSYTGQWRDGNRHGAGIMVNGIDSSMEPGYAWIQPGDKYEGQWVDDDMQGLGQWTHAKTEQTERIKHERGVESPEWPDRQCNGEDKTH